MALHSKFAPIESPVIWCRAGWYTADLPPKTGTYRPFLTIAAPCAPPQTRIKLSSGGTLATNLRPKTRYPSHNSHDKARNSGVSRSAPADHGRGRSPSVDDAVRQLADDMLETMYAAKGVGLAASQVDVHRRLLVLDVSDTRDQPLVLINPEILAAEGRAPGEEGCLSLPGIYDKLERADAHQGACARPQRRAASSSRPTACSRYASSTRWITSKASFSSTICPSSSVN